MVDIKKKIKKMLGQEKNSIDSMKLARLYRLATIDTKTQLNNFRYFNEIFKRELTRSNRYGRPLALLLLDIDDFKKVNDVHGYLKGDDVLQMVAALIKANIRESDVAARFGGEEFVVLLPETISTKAEKMAERIRECICNDSFLAEYKITVSVGVSSQSEKKQETSEIKSAYSQFMPKNKIETSINSQDLFEKANIALNYAKKHGKNRSVMHNKLSKLDFIEKVQKIQEKEKIEKQESKKEN